MSLLKIEVDVVIENTSENPVQVVADILDENNLRNVKTEMISENGPSGWPIFHLTGTKEELERFVEVYSGGNDELETFLI